MSAGLMSVSDEHVALPARKRHAMRVTSANLKTVFFSSFHANYFCLASYMRYTVA